MYKLNKEKNTQFLPEKKAKKRNNNKLIVLQIKFQWFIKYTHSFLVPFSFSLFDTDVRRHSGQVRENHFPTFH